MNNYKLGEILEITSSKRIHAEDYVEFGVPFYRSKEVIQLGRGEKITEVLHISQEQYLEIKSKFPVPIIGDLLLTSVGTIGIPYFVTNPNFYFKDGNLTWFRKFSDCINSKYLLFWMQSNYFKNQINNNNIGAVQKALTIDFLKKFEINLPTIYTQLKIVDVLSSIDSKIELNNHINAELEAMSITLYDYWFVQFDFPFDFDLGKQDPKDKPYKSSGGKMVWNEELKREIPEGWEVESINYYAEVIDPHPSHRAPLEVISGFPFAGIGDIDESGNIDINKARVIDEEFVLKQERDYTINEYSIGYGRVGTVGKVVKLRKQPFRFAISPTMAIINPKNDKLATFVYYTVKSPIFFQWVNKYTSGSTRPAIGIQHLRTIPVIKPKAYKNNNLLDKFEALAKGSLIQSDVLNKQNQQLSELRDWLLPMLMNGQVTVVAKEKASYKIEEEMELAAEPEGKHQ